jgi:hypothetical protein
LYDDGHGTYKVPYEYGGELAMFAIRSDYVTTIQDVAVIVPMEKALEICNQIREAIRSVHKRDVVFF